MSCFGVKHRTTSPFGILNSGELHKGDVCTESIWNHLTRKVPKWGGVGRKDQIPGIQFLVVLMLFCLICLLPKPSISWPSVLTHPRGFKTLWKKKWYSLNYNQINWFRIWFFNISKFPMHCLPGSLTSPQEELEQERQFAKEAEKMRGRPEDPVSNMNILGFPGISWEYVHIHTLYTILYNIYSIYIYIL